MLKEAKNLPWLKKAKHFPWMFIIFQDLLPFADLFTDFISGWEYYNEGHRHWAMCIWALMWLPLVLSIFSEILPLLRRPRSKDTHQQSEEFEMKSLRTDDEEPRSVLPKQTWFEQHEMKIMKFLAQIPFLQPFVHAIFTHKLYKAESGMKKALAKYLKLAEKDITEEQLMELKKNIEAVAKDYIQCKNEKSGILTTFQGIRLFELIGESGPQAILQVSIALRIGYTGWVQVRVTIIEINFCQGQEYK